VTQPEPARAGVAAALLFAQLASPAAADEAVPFRTRNLSPLVSIFGVPTWEPVPVGQSRAGVTTELANHYRFSRRRDETLILDGETWRTAFWVQHAFGERWSASIEIPYYRQSGGVLDDLIDAWHTAFRMPDGGRNLRAEGQLEFELADAVGTFYSLDRSGGALGDVLVAFGASVGADRQTFLRAAVKLPVGDEDLLAGSGSVDAAVTLLRSREIPLWNRGAGYFWGVGALWLGEPDRIRFDARRGGWLGIAGASLKAWPRVGLKAQIEVHSALYDSPLKEIGDTGVQLTIGGWRELGPRAIVELAVNEDLAVSTSPDVVLHVNLRWNLQR
jgi:hypothetical protein